MANKALPKQKQDTWLELTGKSREMAHELDQLVLRFYDDNPVPLNGRNMGDIQKDYAERMLRFQAMLKEQKAHLLDAIGLNTPVTQVSRYKDGYPRAYTNYPALFVSHKKQPDGKPVYLLHCPIGYNGDRFAPAASKPVADDAFDGSDFGYIVHKKYGFISEAPIMYRGSHGCALPPDYEQKRSRSLQAYFGVADTRTQVCFVAGPKTLELVRDHDKRTADWQAAIDRYREELRRIIETHYLDDIKKHMPDGESCRINIGYSYGGSHGKSIAINLAVCMDGTVNIMDGGKKLPISNNDHFLVEKSHTDYVPTPNPYTAEGKELKKLFDSIPPRPGYEDYPGLIGNFDYDNKDDIEKMVGINGFIPRISTLGDLTILTYNSDESIKSDFCPLDCRKLSTATYLWLRADEEDRNMGRRPPPMPDAVQNEIRANLPAAGTGKPPKPLPPN